MNIPGFYPLQDDYTIYDIYIYICMCVCRVRRSPQKIEQYFHEDIDDV